MDYTIRHITRFRYSAPIAESIMEVRMQPRRDENQHCLSFELTTDPYTRITVSRDYLGNIVQHFDVLRPHDQLTITARSLVSTTPSKPLQPLGPSAWHALDQLINEDGNIEMVLPSHFAQPSQLLREFADELEISRRDDPLTVVQQLNQRLFQQLSYKPKSTRVDSPIDEALSQRAGVCQDFSHIMIAMLRELGIPARYVSGYLYHHRDDQSMRSPDATHAWVEVLLPELGWIGFDPTNNMLASERHIKVAIGRDYADVPPTRGVFKGQADTELGVAVQVSQSQDYVENSDDELLLVMKQLSPPRNAGEQPEQQQQNNRGV